jgi:dipeptidyl aminopeptidase/acylaminoacyl peptidase
VKSVRPFGSWPSRVGADVVARAATALSQPAIDGPDTYWLESRPSEGGRVALVRRGGEDPADVLPAGFSVRSRVHEYGGAAYAVHGGTAYFSHDGDGRVYRAGHGEPPAPLTPAGPFRYADFAVDAPRRRLLCVREDHSAAGRPPRNEIIAVGWDGGEPGVFAGGHDFVSSIRLNPRGDRAAWLTWDAPDMPWDATTLWVADIGDDGLPRRARAAAGGTGVSVFQPEWSPAGELWFVSDRSGWWNLYRRGRDGDGPEQAVLPMDAEFGRPQWQLGLATYGFVAADRLACAYTRGGVWKLAWLDARTGEFTHAPAEVSAIHDLRAGAGRLVMIAASPSAVPTVVEVDAASGGTNELRRGAEVVLAPGECSEPRHITFRAPDGLEAHAFYYAPASAEYEGGPGERPPLIVRGHGGPTSAATTGLSLEIQFWTSRGFAVADVNYRGSTGYGRAYRERLHGAWGVADADELAAAVRHVVEAGLANAQRLIVRGSSAAGFAALCALARHNVFAAAGIYYGVSDLAALAAGDHKFEARYLDRLVGPYPERADRYHARSPRFHADRIRCPVIFFQGLDDRVVPAEQTTAMADALRANGVPVEVRLYEGESHGFRKAETIRDALETELRFYRRVLGLGA